MIHESSSRRVLLGAGVVQEANLVDSVGSTKTKRTMGITFSSDGSVSMDGRVSMMTEQAKESEQTKASHQQSSQSVKVRRPGITDARLCKRSMLMLFVVY